MASSLIPRRVGAAVLSIVTATAMLVAAWAPPSVGPVRAAREDIKILGGRPATIDPAAAGDAGSSGVIAQLFETLTAIDPSLTVRPALAGSWDVLDDGRRVVFHLREGLTFSDGKPLGAADVVRSWLRVIDPEAPSPLVALMLDVRGAREYLAGEIEASELGLKANGRDVEVELVRPASEFPSVVASPTFAIVPEGFDGEAWFLNPRDFAWSGGYKLDDDTGTELTLQRNDRYWAGPPPIKTIHLISDIGGQSSVSAFEAGDLDYAPIGDFDASWIRFDPDLGPRLRTVPALTTEFLGFNTTIEPFDDPRIRRAFAQAIDWTRLVTLAGTRSVVPATSMVPTGVPGRSELNFIPPHDPDAARALLAEAGYPGGEGFPEVTFLTAGGTVNEGFIADIRRELSLDVRYEEMGDGYFDRLESEPPQIWSMAWVADYPGPNDFLGVLLGTGATSNYGRWSNAEFDAAIRDAGEATDPAQARAAYDRAEAIVQREAPVIPIAYSPGWALARDGLLGATENGLGSLRFAGLAWAE